MPSDPYADAYTIAAIQSTLEFNLGPLAEEVDTEAMATIAARRGITEPTTISQPQFLTLLFLAHRKRED